MLPWWAYVVALLLGFLAGYTWRRYRVYRETGIFTLFSGIDQED